MCEEVIIQLVVETVWTANQADWQTVYMRFGDISSTFIIYRYASVLSEPNKFIKYIPATRREHVNFVEKYIKDIRDEATCPEN